MEIPKTYDPSSVEDKWYKYWMEKEFFKSVPDERESYTIVIPPPNVTGILHMGHMLNNTIQDVLIRRARMLGKNACWVPGTDHASIATEAKVVAMLKEKGISKTDLTREEFLKHAWEWKEKHGGIILKQLEKLGASCDWSRTRFTMDDDLNDAVISVFIDLHNKGYIYRGVRMVNWDPQGLTAVSDEEVIYKEVNSKLYYVRYKIEGAEEWITIATVRPETILGDTGVCVHRDDPRYKHLKGKHCIIPIVNRSVPIIFDDYIDMEFGTGALKVTPAHDINDYNLGVKHGLEVIDTIAADGKMSAAAKFYVGEDRFVVRKKIIKDLDALGNLVKVEDYKNKVGYSERTDAVIEPKLSMQWFLKMDVISKPALENVLNGNIKLIPDKFINTYKHWMENVHDWCISRQLWWGQRIPAWYDEKGNYVVAKTAEEAVKLYQQKFKNSANFNSQTPNLRQDEDVLDTWFSSWLWPISVFNGFKDPNNKDIQYYYPTNDLITAPEILFFWVARMIIAGYEYTTDSKEDYEKRKGKEQVIYTPKGKKPFTNVYLTGVVRDKQGRKMSKSLGNSPDAIELIKKYSADGVRVGMLLSSPAGNDLLFDESSCEQGRNFANKVWNAFRLVNGWEVDAAVKQPQASKLAYDWFSSKLFVELKNINDLYSKHRISEALMASYKLVWDDFCSWYLEIVKPDFVDGKSLSIDSNTYSSTIELFEDLLKILHPFMPFITEELWHLIKERDDDCLIVAKWPERANDYLDRGINYFYLNKFQISTTFKKIFDDFEKIKEGIKFIRKVRQQTNLSNSKKISVTSLCQLEEIPSLEIWRSIIQKLSGSELKFTERHIDKQGVTLDVNQPLNKMGYYVFSWANIDWYIEKSGSKSIEDIQTLVEELSRLKNFLMLVQSKLANERFIASAKPEIIANEKKKEADAEAKIKAIEEQLARTQS